MTPPVEIDPNFGRQASADPDAGIPEEARYHPDPETVALDAQARFEMRVASKIDDLRVTEAARARIAADKEAGLDFNGLYYDRADLNQLPTFASLVDGVLPRHSYGILRGRDHTLKTFVALDWACCLATGKTWLGRPVDPVRVLYIAGEGAHGLSQRIDAWEYAWNQPVPTDMLTTRRLALNLYQPGPAFTELLHRVETGGYGLVIVDTLRRVSGAAEGNGSDMGLVIDNLAVIKDATDNGSVLVISHTDKHDIDSRGYSGIEDDADFVWHAKRDEMFLRLELTKMKDGVDGRTLNLQAQPVMKSLVLNDATGTPVPTSNESQVRVLDTMRELFPDGAHSGVLKSATGLADATFYRAIKDLKAGGHIANTGAIKRPYYEIPTLETDSHELSPDETPSDLHNSHDSHALPDDSHPTLTALTSSMGESTESKSNTTDQPEDTE